METITLTGYINSIRYYDKNNFYVIKLENEENETYNIIGNYHEDITYIEGKYFSFECVKQGDNFKFVSFVESFPNEKKSIIKTFTSIKGIGPKKAELIFNTFGNDTFEILIDNPDLVDKVEGLSKVLKGAVKSFLKENYKHSKELKKLQDLDLTFNQAMEIITHLKDEEEDIMDLVNENPYIILSCIPQLGFHFVDSIAMKLGFPKTHPYRLQEIIHWVLMQNEQQGNTCMTKFEFMKWLQIHLAITTFEIRKLLLDLELATELEYVIEDGLIYSNRLKAMEDKVAYFLKGIYETEQKYPGTLNEFKSIISNNEYNGVVRYSDDQKSAITMVYSNNISILTGEAGSGKTTTLKGIVKAGEEMGYKVVLCAPTGAASRKMTNSIGQKAYTMHRVLEPEFDVMSGKLTFKRNRLNYIDANLIIVDEASMVDLSIFLSFIEAVNPETKLLFCGDPEQLKPVGIGQPFYDMLRSGAFAHTHLSEVFRTAKDNQIYKLAKSVLEGRFDIPNPKESKQVFFVERNSTEDIATYIKELVDYKLNQTYDNKYNPMTDIQVLMPRKDKKSLSVKEYNKVLQSVLNPYEDNKEEILKGRKDTGAIFRTNDKIMQIKNNPEKSLFNGDTGFIKKVENDTVSVKFDDIGTVDYSYDELDELQHSYSMTVHKAQGQEYKVVIIPINQNDYMFFNRSWVYTATTRAKELLIFVGDKNVIENGLKLNQNQDRLTTLDKAIRRVLGLEKVKQEKKIVKVKKVNHIQVQKKEEYSKYQETMNLIRLQEDEDFFTLDYEDTKVDTAENLLNVDFEWHIA